MIFVAPILTKSQVVFESKLAIFVKRFVITFIFQEALRAYRIIVTDLQNLSRKHDHKTSA